MTENSNGRMSKEQFFGLAIARLDTIERRLAVLPTIEKRLDAVEQMLAVCVPEVTKLLAMVVHDQQALDNRVKKLEGRSAA